MYKVTETMKKKLYCIRTRISLGSQLWLFELQAVLVLGRAGHSHRKGEPQRMRMSPEDDVGP